MDDKLKKRISRRSFLIGIPAGVASVVAINAVGSRIFRRGAAKYPKFPEGSIFAPANDRTDV